MKTRIAWIALALVAFAGTALAADDLAAGFAKPPDEAKPRTWWHWVTGNVTKEGITADLEAMKHIGLGGAQMFHVNQGPQGPVSPICQKLSCSSQRKMRSLGTPATFCQSCSASSSSRKTVT